MPDRRRRTAFRFPRPERSALLMRERQSSSPDSGSAGKSPDSGSAGKPQEEENPFAAPPADRPDQPWQPRRPSGSQGQGSDEQDDNGSGSGGDRPAWGSQWSDRQPGRGSGGFGGRPGGNGAGGPGGKGGNDRGPGGLRWDPTDPAQRRARYAVLGGMWAFFFALFDFPEIALLLGALATYWAISALRTPLKNASATDRTAVDGGSAGTPANPAAPGASANPAAPAPPSNVSSRQQTTAAVGGLVTALLALLIVATSYTVQLVYRDYYTCVDDALTKSASVACNDKLPKPLEPFFGVKE